MQPTARSRCRVTRPNVNPSTASHAQKPAVGAADVCPHKVCPKHARGPKSRGSHCPARSTSPHAGCKPGNQVGCKHLGATHAPLTPHTAAGVSAQTPTGSRQRTGALAVLALLPYTHVHMYTLSASHICPAGGTYPSQTQRTAPLKARRHRKYTGGQGTTQSTHTTSGSTWHTAAALARVKEARPAQAATSPCFASKQQQWVRCEALQGRNCLSHALRPLPSNPRGTQGHRRLAAKGRLAAVNDKQSWREKT